MAHKGKGRVGRISRMGRGRRRGVSVHSNQASKHISCFHGDTRSVEVEVCKKKIEKNNRQLDRIGYNVTAAIGAWKCNFPPHRN